MTRDSKDSIALSVIIPAYNAEKYIKKCVNSILVLKSMRFEIVVINDGSTDGTLQVLQTIHDARLKYYTIQNAGVSNARNVGIEKAKGKYVWFVDADDFVCAKDFEVVFEDIKKDMDVIMFGYKSKSKDLIKEYKPCVSKGIYSSLTAKDLAKRMVDPFFAKRYHASYISGKVYQYIIRAEIFKKNHSIRFDKNLPFAEDMCFLVQLLNYVNNIQVSDRICYIYMIYPGTAAHRYREAYWEELYRVYTNILNLKILSPEEQSRLYYRYVKEALFHYAEWSNDSKDIKEYYSKIIDSEKIKICIDTINYNNWTILEKIENALIINKSILLIFLIEKMKSFKEKLLEA